LWRDSTLLLFIVIIIHLPYKKDLLITVAQPEGGDLPTCGGIHIDCDRISTLSVYVTICYVDTRENEVSWSLGRHRRSYEPMSF